MKKIMLSLTIVLASIFGTGCTVSGAGLYIDPLPISTGIYYNAPYYAPPSYPNGGFGYRTYRPHGYGYQPRYYRRHR